MKNKYLSLCLLTLLALPLVGCGETNPITESISPMIKNAIDSLRGKTHKVDIKQTVSVLRPIPEGMTPEDPNWQYLPLDIYQEYNNTLGYYYTDTEKAFSRKTHSLYADLDKLTGEFMTGSIREYDNPEELFFRDNDDGTTYSESINYKNELSINTVANLDDNTGVYSPIIFDSEFKNPFDYISYRDVEIKEDGKSLRLTNEKADFLSECYNTIGMNFIKDNTINLDDNGNIVSIDFDIPDYSGQTYTRKNTFSVTYIKNENLQLNHLTEFTNNNPELQNALDILDNKKNFTYIKEMSYKMTDAEGVEEEYNDRIKGYFTEDEVYFHHETTDNDTHPYIGGDNYDYKAKLNSDGTSYTCYEYTPDGVSFDWGIVMLSSSSPYIINSFSGIGPSFMDMNASIFAKTDENTYDAEIAVLPSLGTYFDFGMMGVQSAAFEENTIQLTIKLDGNGNIEVIESSFVFSMIKYDVKFYIQDVGTTVIPEWSETSMPVPEYSE